MYPTDRQYYLAWVAVNTGRGMKEGAVVARKLTNGLGEIVGVLHQLLSRPAQRFLVGVVEAQPGLVGTDLAAFLDAGKPLLCSRLCPCQLLQDAMHFSNTSYNSNK